MKTYAHEVLVEARRGKTTHPKEVKEWRAHIKESQHFYTTRSGFKDVEPRNIDVQLPKPKITISYPMGEAKILIMAWECLAENSPMTALYDVKEKGAAAKYLVTHDRVTMLLPVITHVFAPTDPSEDTKVTTGFEHSSGSLEDAMDIGRRLSKIFGTFVGEYNTPGTTVKLSQRGILDTYVLDAAA